MSGKSMVKRDVSDSFDGAMPGNCRDRHGKLVLQCGINRDKSFRAASEKHLTVLFNQVLAMAMMVTEFIEGAAPQAVVVL